MKRYTQPDCLAHVYAFAHTEAEADAIAREANRNGVTRKGKFHAGTFRAAHIPGRVPAVVGDLTGNGGTR